MTLNGNQSRQGVAGGKGRVIMMWRGKHKFDLNKNISRASLLLCKHNKKLHKSKTSNLKLNLKPAWYILKRGYELRNSLAGGTGKTLFGAATTVLDKRNSKRSIGIMIFLMEAVVASIFWLEDAPINTSNTIYVTYTLRKAYHILVWFGSVFAHFAFSLSSSSIFFFFFSAYKQ